MHKPGLTVLADQTNKSVDLSSSNVLLEQLAVVMKQSCDCVLCQDVIADLFLHEAELFGNILLWDRDRHRQSARAHKLLQDGNKRL